VTAEEAAAEPAEIRSTAVLAGSAIIAEVSIALIRHHFASAVRDSG
jgi:hypothetical protein